MMRRGLFVFLAAFACRAAVAQETAAEIHAARISLEEIADGFRAIESWQIGEARAIAERAVRDLPDHPLTLALLAEVKMHMSDYRGAATLFEKAREAGAPHEILSSAPIADATRIATEGYEEHIADNFIVRYTPGKDEILLPYAIDTLERARARIGELLGWRPDSRIVLEIYPSAGTLAQVSTLTKAEIQNSGTIALCKWNRLMITSPRAVTFGYAWRDTISHELTHLIIGGASKNTVPIWLHEGIAKFAESAWRGEPGDGLSIEQQLSLRDAAKKGKLIPFEKMHPSMAKLKTQEETALAFAEVFTFIEFLIDRKGWEGMRAVLERMRAGESDEEAIEAVHGKSLKKLSEEWMRGLKNREIKQTSGEGTSPKVEVKDRPDAPDDRLHGVSKKGRRYARAADLLFMRGRVKAAQKELEKAIKETGSPLLSAKLAMVALATGDLDAAEGAAKKAIEGSPDLAGPNVTLAEILVRRGKKEEAVAVLDRAISVNPFDPRIHQLLLHAGDEAQVEYAKGSLAFLQGERAASPNTLGDGGLIQVEGTPFSRIYFLTGKNVVPTGMITPSPAIELRPGNYEMWLVPPNGRKMTRTISVAEKAKDGTPQKIVPEPEGS
jgi:tetratricopeptide (TPR) repeat protein